MSDVPPERGSVHHGHVSERERLHEEPPWVRVYGFEKEADVYFSHKRHVKANVSCQTCHGDQQNATDARERVHWTMGKCIDCHRENKVSDDCLTCHK